LSLRGRLLHVVNQTYVIVSKRDGKELARVERTYDDFVHLQQSLKVRKAASKARWTSSKH